MNKIISIILIVLLIIPSVLVVTSVDETELEKVDVESSEKSLARESKKQEILNVLQNTRDFIIFDDPVIFNEFVSFEYYVFMFETYIETLYTDFIEVENILADNLDAEIINVNNAYINTLEVDNIESDELIVSNQLSITALSQNTDNEYSYACFDSEGNIFRSDIACPELTSEPEDEFWFSEIGELITINFQDQDFVIELISISNESSVLGDINILFRINGDYELIRADEEVSVNGLFFRVRQVFFANNEFQALEIVLYGLSPINVLIIEDLPFEYQFSNLYENFRFDYNGLQDIEIIELDTVAEEITFEVNDESAGTVVAGESITLNGVGFYIDSVEFINNELRLVSITIQEINIYP